MIKIAIIDDVQEEQELIYEKISKYFINHKIIDFLIDMFEDTESFLNSNEKYYGVFISSFDEYIFRAIHNSTYDYVRKKTY